MYCQFASESQQARAMQTLLSRSGCSFGDGLCTEHQPTDTFFRLVQNLGALSHGEQVLLRIALDIWNGEGGVALSELFVLDGRNQSVVLSLLRAVSGGPRAIEAWLAGTEH